MQNRDHDIFTAIRNQDVKLIKDLVKSGIDLSINNEEKKTPIEFAARLKYWTCVETISKHRSVEPGMAEMKYGSALLDAVKDESVNTVKELLDAKAPMNWEFTKTGNGVLHVAVLKKNVEIIKLLLAHQVNLTQLNQDKKTAIQLAADNKSWDIVELIAKDNVDSDDKAKFGSSLLEVVEADRLETAEYLLKAKASLAWRFQQSHNYCLHVAVKNNSEKMIDLLLKYNANQAQINQARQTPIELACSLGHWECAARLIRGKQITFNDPVLASKALIASMQAKQYQLLNYLIKAGASIKELSEEEGDTLLHIAVRKNDIELIKILLKNEVLPLHPNKEGKTEIELASELQQWVNVEFFLKKDKKITTLPQYYKNAHYKKVLWNAIRYNHYYVAERLLQRKIDCQDTNGEMGNVALYWAIKNSNPTMVTLLLSYGADAEVRNKDGQSMYDLADAEVRNKDGQSTYDLALVRDAKMCYQCMIDHKNSHLKEMSSPRKKPSDQIKLYLRQLQCDLAQQPWKVKNICWHWVDGIPYHVREIQYILKNMNSDNEDDIFNTYAKILGIFFHIKPLIRRHPSTTIFYNKKRKELISFISQQGILNTALSYPVVLNQPLPTLQPYMGSMLYQDVSATMTQPMSEPPSYQEALTKTSQAMHETLALANNVPPTHLYPILPDMTVDFNTMPVSYQPLNFTDQTSFSPYIAEDIRQSQQEANKPLSLFPMNDNRWFLPDEDSLLDQTVAPIYMTVANNEATFTSPFPKVPTHVAFFPTERKAIGVPVISEKVDSSLQMKKRLAIAE